MASGPRGHEPRKRHHFRSGIAHGHRVAAAPQHRQIGKVVTEHGSVASRDTEGGTEPIEVASLVERTIDEVTDPEFFEPMAETHPGASGDHGNLAAEALPDPQAASIVGVVTLGFDAVIGEGDGPVGQYSVHIKNEQSHAPRVGVCRSGVRGRRSRGLGLGHARGHYTRPPRMAGSERINLHQSVLEAVSTVQTAVNVGMTVGEALDELRSRTVGHPVLYIYVLDDDDRLVGVLPTRALLLSKLETPIREVMVSRFVSLRASETVGDALLAFAAYRLLALPVVDDEGHMIGAIDVQIYADETFELAEAQRVNALFQMLGVSVRDARDRSPWRGFRGRMPWLCWNLVGGTACALIAKAFDATLTEFIILAMFIPLVLTLAESVAMQSMSLVLEVLQDIGTRQQLVRSRLITEAGTAVLLGACCGAIVGTTGWAFGGGALLGLVLFGAIGLSMVVAASIGALVPVGLRSLRLDPSIAAGPIALTCTDVLATSIYLGGATIVLT